MERESRYGAFLLLLLVFTGVFFLAHFGMRSGPGGTVLVLAARSERHSQAPSASSSDTNPVTDNAVKSADSVHAAPARKGRSASDTTFPGFPVDINSASVDELMKVPGIGPKTARRIVEKRLETGGFRTINELTGVQRIGRVRLESIRRYITVNAVRPAEG